jgi:hypothetical protein
MTTVVVSVELHGKYVGGRLTGRTRHVL